MNNSSWNAFFQTFQPTPQQVEDLISAAQNHPLGMRFLLEGDLGAVATIFQTHAFTVEAARDRLKATDPPE